MQVYFGNYRRLVYLAQAPEAKSSAEAGQVAARLGLEYEMRTTGYGGLEKSLHSFVDGSRAIQWRA